MSLQENEKKELHIKISACLKISENFINSTFEFPEGIFWLLKMLIFYIVRVQYFFNHNSIKDTLAIDFF